jgi:hypothetical protein
MSREDYPPLREISADTENTVSSLVAYWTVITELLPDNALMKYVKTSFNLKNLNEVQGKEQYRLEISNRFAGLENLDTEGDILMKLGKLSERI